MIKILTLMLGLMVGSSELELRVSPEVRRVEIRVDGRLQQELVAPPWRTQVDWGEGLMPHELEAVAFDADGRELARDRRWINMRSSEAEALLSFPAPTNGRLPFAELSWATVGLTQPRSVSAQWGDRSLEVGPDWRIQLPKYDPEELHWLSVEVDFGTAGQRSLGASIGGESLFELSTELTAVPVRARSRRAAAKRAGEISVRGDKVRVHGIEEGTAEVVMVVDAGAAAQLDGLASTGKSQSIQPLNTGRGGDLEGIVGTMSRDSADFGRLGQNTDLSFVWPRASAWAGARLAPDSFPTSPERSLSSKGLLAANHGKTFGDPALEDDLPSAVAVAGLTVAGTTRRRAVVLIAARPVGDSAAVAETVRFLEVSRVPLHVWTVGPEQEPSPWPNARHLGDLSRASRFRTNLWGAIKDLRADLDSQVMVWVKGNYLPQAVTVPRDLKLTPGD